jgi:alpha-tubulin suppressor-like RCC1 family protein
LTPHSLKAPGFIQPLSLSLSSENLVSSLCLVQLQLVPLHSGRTLYTFGRGFHGQLGQGGYDDAAGPAVVSLANTGFVDPSAVETVSCGASHCAALDPDGREGLYELRIQLTHSLLSRLHQN